MAEHLVFADPVSHYSEAASSWGGVQSGLSGISGETEGKGGGQGRESVETRTLQLALGGDLGVSGPACEKREGGTRERKKRELGGWRDRYSGQRASEPIKGLAGFAAIQRSCREAIDRRARESRH